MSETVKQPLTAMDVKELLRSMYGGENKRITDDDYDKSLAVRCRNGIFVGKKTEHCPCFAKEDKHLEFNEIYSFRAGKNDSCR